MEVEQPLILEWVRGCLAHIQIDCLLYRCTIREDWLEDIDVWIHEFIEQHLLSMERIEDSFITLEDGSTMEIVHILTSLCVSSGWEGVIIDPDQFWEYLILGQLICC